MMGEPLKQHVAQERFCELASSHRVALFVGGLQAGKSIAGADALGEALYGVVDDKTGEVVSPALKLPAQAEGLVPEVWILSKDYKLADAAWGYFRWRFGSQVMSPQECKSAGLQRGDARTYWLKPSLLGDNVPIMVRVRTAHDPESLRAVGTLLAAWCDEIAHWPELAWLNLQGRGIVTPTRYLITTTPKGRNWLYRDVYLPGEEARDPSIGVVRCRSVDNPWADKEYLEQLRRKFGPEYAAQELDALFTANVGYVYDFERAKHMAPPPSEDPEQYRSRVVGVDPGYGDPYAACLCLKDWDGKWWVADEMYLPSKAIVDDAVPKLAEWVRRWKVERIYVDKRRPSDWEALRRKGFPAIANLDVFGEDGTRTVMPMIRMVQRLFREDRLRVAPHCEWFAEEAENYAFPSTRAKNAGENPVDFKNHLMDALRYAICSVDALPEDRRPRARNDRTGEMEPVGRLAVRPEHRRWNMPSVAESLAFQEKEWESLGDKERRRWG